LFGVPLSIYRQFVTESAAWLSIVVWGGDVSDLLQHDNRLYYLAGYVSKRYEVATAQQNYSTADDVASFVRGIFARMTGKPVPSND
jgi:hypothetical protein